MYEYTSNAVRLSWRIIKGDEFDKQALDLLERLSLKRKSDPRRPILFIAHSLGGILVKTVSLRPHVEDGHWKQQVEPDD